MWEKDWLDPKVELFMFRQLKGAFKYDRLVMVPKLLSGYKAAVEQYDSIEEAIDSTSGIRVYLEPTGTSKLTDIPNDDVVYILGCAGRSNKNLVHENDLFVRIDTPGTTDMFAVNAISIALHERQCNGNR